MASLITAFTFKKTITFDTTVTGANTSGAVANAAIPIHITSDSWATQSERDDFFDNAGAQGDRVQFFDSDETTNLNYAVLNFDNTQGAEEAIYLVEVPSVAGGSSTDNIVVAYGNDPNGVAQNDDTGTVSSYAGWWPLGDNFWGSSPEAKDIKGSNHGTNSGTGDLAGVVGRGREFGVGGTLDDSISLGDSLDVGTADFSIRALINTSGTDTNGSSIVSKDVASQGRWYVNLLTTGVVRAYVSDNSNTYYADSTATLLDGNDHDIIAVFDRSEASVKIYIDGALETLSNEVGTLSSVGSASNTTSLLFGDDTRLSNLYFDGLIDELVITADVITSDEAKIFHMSGKIGTAGNAWNGYDWISWGPQESAAWKWTVVRVFGS